MPQSTDNDILTTFQAARLCGVSHKSIERWIDSGHLEGYRTPGGHRRLNRSDLLTLIASRRTKRDAGRLTHDSDRPRILLVGDRSLFGPSIASQLSATGRFEVLVAASCFEAGMLAERLRPQVVALDISMDCHGGSATWNLLRNDAEHSSVLVVGVADSRQRAEAASDSGLFHATLVAPLSRASLESTIDGLIGGARFVRTATAYT